MSVEIKILTATIDQKIAGHQLGLEHLKANNKGLFTDNVIALTEMTIKDLEEIKKYAVIYEELVNAVINKGE